MGIIICGLNGAGKSTLGKALAEKLHFYFIDIENLYFPKTSDAAAFAFAITADNKVIGSIGVFRQENIHRQTGALGHYISEEYWGKGIMTEAVKQICEYVFSNSDIIRIYAESFAYNITSCRVLEKAGFQYEGTL